MLVARGLLHSVFPRRQRFPRALFPTALKGGRRLSSPHFSIILPREGAGYAVVVSKKVARLSVTRHRIKRRILEVLRTLPLPQALIIFPKSSAADIPRQEIYIELETLLSNTRS